MTQEEEKQLLLQDLCGRLPYGVKVRINTKNNHYNAIVCEITRNYICVEGGGETCFSHGTYKPYLRPMSSMTEEEHDYYNNNLITNAITICEEKLSDYLEFMHSHHIDYRGLIPMGLGIDCTGLNIYENEKSI